MPINDDSSSTEKKQPQQSSSTPAGGFRPRGGATADLLRIVQLPFGAAGEASSSSMSREDNTTGGGAQTTTAASQQQQQAGAATGTGSIAVRLESLENRLAAFLTSTTAGTSPPVGGEFARELADQVRKSVAFTANVAGGALRINELKGVLSAPSVSREALELSTAAVRMLESELTTRHQPSSATTASGRLADAFGRYLGKSTSQISLPDLEQPLSPAESLACSSEDSDFTEDRSLLVGSAATADAVYLTVKPRRQEKRILTKGPRARRKVADQQVKIATAGGSPPSPTRERAWDIEESALLDRFTLMTFNAGLLEYRLAGVNCYANPPYTRRRLYQLPLALKAFSADLVCLQEVYDSWQANFLAASLKSVYPFIARRRSGGTFALHNGLMILSRFPILRVQFHPFQAVTRIERFFGSKGMLEAVVEVPTVGAVTLVNIHLASGAVDPESKALEEVRNQELEQAVVVARAAAARGEYPIIIGDLNAAPNLCAGNYKMLLKNGFCDGFLLAISQEKHASPLEELEHLNSLAAATAGHQDKTTTYSLGDQGGRLSRSGAGALEPSLSHSRSLIQPPAAITSSKPAKYEKLRGGVTRKLPSPRWQHLLLACSSRSRLRPVRNLLVDGPARTTVTAASLRPFPRDRLPGAAASSSPPQQHKRYLFFRWRRQQQQPRTHAKYRVIPTEQPLLDGDNDSSTSAAAAGCIEMGGLSGPRDDTARAITNAAGIVSARDLPSSAESTAASAKRIAAPSQQQPPMEAAPRACCCCCDCSQCRSNSSGSRRRPLVGRLSTGRRLRMLRHTSGGSRGSPHCQRCRKQLRQQLLQQQPSSSQHSSLEQQRTPQTRHPQIVNVTPSGVLEYQTVPVDLNHDPFCTALYTWDPRNPLNVIGPHAACHGLRCDHIFLPVAPEVSPSSTMATDMQGGLTQAFSADEPRVLFTDPRVTVEGCCCGLLGRGRLVTLSDHYGLAVSLRRRRS